MFFDADIKGCDLPPKTLCLTYDDGPGESADDEPGPKTTALGRYLFEQGISATFFVIGQHAEQYPESLRALAAYGHSIGNHTFTHPGLVALAERSGDVVGELARTDALIWPYHGNAPVFFRAPYGNWRQVDPETNADRSRSIVAKILNESRTLKDTIGPVNWDISCEDFSYWRRGDAAEGAAAAYLAEIERVGRGIVLMHDSSDDPAMRRNNRTLELTMLLVPELRRRGYEFVALRELPQVRRIVAEMERQKFKETSDDDRATRNSGYDYAQPPRGDAAVAGEHVRLA